MTTAMMITSSSEDINIIKMTRNVIAFVSQILADENSLLDSANGIVITKEDAQHLESYYETMYNFLINPGMTETEFREIQETNS